MRWSTFLLFYNLTRPLSDHAVTFLHANIFKLYDIAYCLAYAHYWDFSRSSNSDVFYNQEYLKCRYLGDKWKFRNNANCFEGDKRHCQYHPGARIVFYYLRVHLTVEEWFKCWGLYWLGYGLWVNYLRVTRRVEHALVTRALPKGFRVDLVQI